MSVEKLEEENADLRRRLEEAEETLRAIQNGAVDAFLVNEAESLRVYTLEGADRPYRLLVEEMQQGAATLTIDGTIIYCNRQLATLLKFPHHRLAGRNLRDFITPSHHANYNSLLRQGATSAMAGEAELGVAGDTIIPVYFTFNVLPEDCGAAVGVLVTDLTSQRHQEQQKLLLDELNHRVKNTLASVQAIAQQTLRKSGNPKEFARSFMGRIQALARVHTMLAGTTWAGADLAKLVRDQVSLGAEEDGRVGLGGPAVMLDPQLTMHLAMVMHELGTNSAKYGALSVPEGRLNVSWEVERGLLQLKWQERSGPTTVKPDHRGFGTLFIEQTIASHNGSADAVYLPEGVHWSIILPLKSTPSETSVTRTSQAGIDASHLQAGRSNIRNKRVLVVEDEPLVAMDVVTILEQAGAIPIGPASTIAEALRLIRSERIDAALVDANLQGRPVAEIAWALRQQDVPFAFVTGYGREGLPHAFQDAAMVSKPFTESALVTTLASISARSTH